VLRRNRQRPSKRHRRGGCRRRRGSSCSGNWTAPGCGAKRPSPSPLRGAGINAQLAQARKLEAKLAEEYRTVRLLRASIAGEASARGERARELGRQAHDCINADFNVDNPDTPPRASQKLVAAATLLRAMPAPSTPEAQNLHREAQHSSSKRPSNRPKARHPAPPAGERAGRWGCARPRALGARGRRS
jgi:hypothetical protein